MTERITERIEGLLNRVPGYTGYRQKESMRDDDRRLRDEIARSLTQASGELSALGGRLAADRRLDVISAVEDAISRIRHLESRVRTASYGYGGIFSDRSVDQYALQQLKEFDVVFQARVDDLTREISAVAAGDGADSAALAPITQKIAELGRLFDSRGDVIETATPTQDPDVLALLQAPRVLSPQERQLLSLRKGGTGAILGDNYQFTAHIALASREGEPVLTLVELDGGPEWLAVHDDGAAVTLWRVQEAASAAGAPGQAASAAVSGPKGSQGDVPATYTVTTTGSGDNARATIQLSLAGSDRAYEGTQIPLLDIQVFSEGSVS